MTGPLRILKHEHRVIERALRALDGVSTRLQWGQPVPAEVLSQLVEFISTFVDRHHHGKEKAYLFPVLERQLGRRDIAPHGGPLDVIELEHAIESELTGDMHRAIGGYKDADPEARQRFVEAARRYTNHLLGHIDKEDGILLRLADEILDEKDKASLVEGFKRAEGELGADACEKYDRMASELERTWAL